MAELQLRTDYAAHDQVYRRLREAGTRPGWDVEEGLARDIAVLDGVLAWPTFPRGGELLEIGCGAGNIALHLAQRGWRVHGVDVSPTAVTWAAENARAAGIEAQFRAGDVRTLEGFGDASMDLVLDGHCLHCIVGDDRAAVLRAVLRVLRPGGIFCVRTMCNDPPASFAERSGYDAVTRCLVREGVATRYIGRSDDILAELAGAGYTVRQWEVIPPQYDGDLEELVALAARP